MEPCDNPSVGHDSEADFIAITGKASQRRRMFELAAEFRRHGRTVLIGGPFASLSPEEVRPHALEASAGVASACRLTRVILLSLQMQMESPSRSRGDRGRRKALNQQLPTKAEIILDWFFDSAMPLRKTLIAVDVDGPRYSVRKVDLLGQLANPPEAAVRLEKSSG